MIKQNRISDAIAAFRMAVRVAPQNAQAWESLEAAERMQKQNR